MISKKNQGIALALVLSAALMTGCAVLPNTYETIPVEETEESVIEIDISDETEEESETEEETEAEETEEETETETEAEPETYAIDEGYTRVNQIVEATQNVNLRTGPGTDYESAGLLAAAEQVERISDNGEWSQIVYEGNVYYVASEYILVVEETEVITRAAENEDGGVSQETEETETEAEAEAKETSTYSWDEIAALPNDSIPYGFSSNNRDELNRPTGVLYYENLYGNYDANFVGPDTEKVVYLTMDEGYEAGYTSTILDVLKEKNVKAVFFVTKQFVTEQPELVQRMIDEGHQIGNHTCSHPSAGMPSLGMQAEYDDILWLHDYVQETFGYTMTLFRFPTGAFSEQSLALVNYMGYTSVFWSFAYADWDTSNQPDPTEALSSCLSSLHNGEIFLLHAVSATNTSILADFIDGVRAAGYEFGVYPSTGF